VNRRALLAGAIAFGAIGALASVVGVVRTRGYALPSGVKLASLAPWEWLLVRALARRICAPDQGGVVSPDDVDVAGFVDAYAAKMPAKMRRDLGRMLAYVEQLAPLAHAKLSSRFTHLGTGDQDRVLTALETSDSALLQGGFEGIKALVFMGFYRDPRTWSILSYEGPLVGRPEEGWVSAELRKRRQEGGAAP
jgi:hypothetical protein